MVPISGQPSWAVVVHSRSQEQRRPERLEQERPASFTPWEVTMREAAQQESVWLFDTYA